MEKLGVSWALRKAGAMANSTTKIEDVNGDVRIASTSTGEKFDFELIVLKRVPLTATQGVTPFKPQNPSLRHKCFTSTKIRHFDTILSLRRMQLAGKLFMHKIYLSASLIITKRGDVSK